MVRVRIAPSPSGMDVHVGNVRTALFNYLFAKQNNGRFIFRIEDTDITRCKSEYADTIASSLSWLGLNADEGFHIGGDYGPYSQMEKLDRYKKVADALVEQKLAYRCYCTPDELTALRNQLPENQRRTFRYPGICRDRTDYPNNKEYVIRFIAPTDGVIEINDLVFGKMLVPNKENFDWVLMRSSGIPLYNFGCVIDDFDQQITHILRGRDHHINTPIQILLHRALGVKELPKFAHFPMMLGADGSKLSKRHASVSITEYKNAGYTPSAIINYLSRFGWAHKNQEIFSMEELIEKFSLEACGKTDGKFDTTKFAAIQFEHLKSQALISDQGYAQLLLPLLQANELSPSLQELEKLIHLCRPRSKTLVEAAKELDPIIRNAITVDKEAETKFLSPDNRIKLKSLGEFLKSVDTWNELAVKSSTNEWLAKNSLSLKDISQNIRVSTIGRTNGPELFQTIIALGKQKTIERLLQ